MVSDRAKFTQGMLNKYSYKGADTINVNLDNRAKSLFDGLGLSYQKIPTLNHNQNLPSKIEGVYKKDNLSLRKNPRVSDKKAEAVAMHEIYHHTQKDKGLELGQEEAQANMIEKAYLNENQQTSQEVDFDLIYAYTIKQFYEHEELEQLVRILGGDSSSARRVYSNAMMVIAEANKPENSKNNKSYSSLKTVGDSGVKYKQSEEKFSTNDFIGPKLPQISSFNSLEYSPLRPNAISQFSDLKYVPQNQSILSKVANENKEIINKQGFVANIGGVNLRYYPSFGDKGVKVLLPHKTLLDIKYIEDDFYFVNTEEYGDGYLTTIPGFVSIGSPLEDSKVTENKNIYIVKKGDTLLDISQKHYVGQANMRVDHNHFVDALAKYNHLKSKDKIYVGQKIEVPSMSTLKKYIVTSLGDEIEGVVGDIIDFVMIVANFADGAINGAIQSIKDTASMPIDIINSIIALIKEIWNLTIFTTIADTISNIINTDWIKVLKEAGQKFIDEWNGMSNNERSYLIGQIVGYLAMEALMLYLGKQIYLKFKLTGLGIKLLALMKKVNIDKLVDVLKKNPKLDEIKDDLKKIDNNQNVSKNEIELEPGKKGSWNKELNQELKPNTNYKVGNKTYETDELGRIKKVQGKLKLKKHDRNTYQQTKSVQIKDGLSNDQGGHLIGTQFDGAGEQINYLPMNANLNQGDWKKMENLWARELKNGKEVKVNIQPIYIKNNKRPNGFKVEYIIDNKKETRFFNNIQKD